LINLIVSLALMGQLGVTGLALGASAAAIAEAIIAAVLLWRWIGPWPGLASLYRLVLATGGMAAVLLMVRGLSLPAILEATLAVGLGAVTFIALAWVLATPEMRWLMSWLRKEKSPV
jgi:peptidoglycan biosynthesis protein MviN/MurJ (putative lipid II flippase)